MGCCWPRLYGHLPKKKFYISFHFCFLGFKIVQTTQDPVPTPSSFSSDPHGSFLDMFHFFPPLFLQFSYQKKTLRMGGLQSFSLDSQFRSDFFSGGCLPFERLIWEKFCWGGWVASFCFQVKSGCGDAFAGFHVGFFGGWWFYCTSLLEAE